MAITFLVLKAKQHLLKVGIPSRISWYPHRPGLGEIQSQRFLDFLYSYWGRASQELLTLGPTGAPIHFFTGSLLNM